MKPITKLKELVEVAKEQNVCPFTNNKSDYKFIWIGEFMKFGCDLLRSRADFDERCSFEDYINCPLFPYITVIK